MPNWDIDLDQTSTFEWYVIKFSFRNGYQKNMCLNEIRLRAQNMITVRGSIAHIIEGNPYDHLMSMKIFTLIMNKIFFINSANYEKNGYGLDSDSLTTTCYLIAYFHIVREVG